MTFLREAELLRAISFDEAQGYLIAKPMDAGDFGAWLSRWDGNTIAKQPIVDEDAADPRSD